MALSKLNLIVEAFFVTNPQSEKMNKKPEFMRKNHYLGFLLTTHFAKKIHVMLKQNIKCLRNSKKCAFVKKLSCL